MPQWLSPELIAIVVLGGLILIALLLLRGRAARPAMAPTPIDVQAAADAARLAAERDAALRAQEEARAMLEAERAALRQSAAELQKTREDLREAAVRAQDAVAAKTRADAADARAVDAEKALEAALTRAREREQAAADKIAALTQFREEMQKQFKALSADALTAQSDSFAKTSKDRMEMLLAPLKEQITRFEAEFRNDGQARVAQRTAMETLVQSLREQTAQVKSEAGNLARALKGQAQTQGAWGEMILKTILEKAGLREGEEFVTQQSHTMDEGVRLRPDVIVNFPDGKKLVLDSKVSLVAFERCVNCEDEAERAAHLKEHLTSLRRHIRGLSDKDYAQLYGGVDFVILFVPVESALSLAIQNDPEIQSDAVARNVMIASPNTLLMGLRTVQNMWVRERQNRNAEEIAKRAGLLYEKFAGFIDDLEKIGDSLTRTRAQYDAAYGKLTGGPGNLVRQAELLKSMGARTGKTISEKTLAVSDERPDAPDEQATAAAPPRPGLETASAEGGSGGPRPRGKATHPERVPGLAEERKGPAKDYDELTGREKFVAASISQDWDA